ncbi:MAG: glutamate racemase [Porphyromonas sp.]|nr:glutamate racemase [Porphyromonas sp.]
MDLTQRHIENITPGLQRPIGVFDSGYGGLTILKSFRELMPEYDYIYLGDNARSPYGNHSFDTIYEYTLQGVDYLFAQGCKLVILACNTASARALRTIQQVDLRQSQDPTRRVLGVIRPTVEHLSQITETGQVGLFATLATVRSGSYQIEAEKYAPGVTLTQQAPQMWVSLVENGEVGDNAGVNYFVQKEVDELMKRAPEIDAIQLACTHYPLLRERIEAAVPPGVCVYGQGAIVAESLRDYLRRHPEMERRLSKGGKTHFLTTERGEHFSALAGRFLGYPIEDQQVNQIKLF